jgi:hypothetical protein
MLIEESKLAIERKAIVEIETQVLLLLEWKIPNFSVRHFLEGLLCIGFATSKDRVYSFVNEGDKALVHSKLQTM